MYNHLIKVTAADIKGAQSGIGLGCPIARAINRTLNRSVLVGYKIAFLGKQQAQLPLEICQFIQKFDDGDIVTPINFRLEINSIHSKFQKYCN